MTSISPAVPTNLPAKRKRAQISYAELENDRLDSAHESWDNDELLDDDPLYSARKDPGTSKRTALHKKTKFVKPELKKPSKPFSFLALPAELRDYIYELALTDQGGLAMVSKTKALRRTITRGLIFDYEGGYYYDRNGCKQREITYDADKDTKSTHNPLTPNLLAVNKQIHAEAVGYLYKQPLILQDTMTLHTFLAAMGASNRVRVSNLIVKGWGDGRGTHKAMNFCAFTLLAGCTNLKSLNLDCSIDCGRTPEQLAGQLYRDGHYFFEAYGVANGSRDAAVRVLKIRQSNYGRLNRTNSGGSRSLPKLETPKQRFQGELTKLLLSVDDRIARSKR